MLYFYKKHKVNFSFDFFWLTKFILIALVITVPIVAGTTGKIKGKVIDKDSGEPILGANVVVEGTYFGAATDDEGDYYINNVPPGTYNLIASAVGYNKVRVENLSIKIDLTTEINIELVSEAIEMGEVVVQAEQPLITKDLTSTSAIVSSEEIQMMPVDNLDQVIDLQAGVIRDAGGRLHFRGGRSDEVAYLVDGIPVNDAFNGEFSLEVENNSVRQLEVISGTFNAEYGQALSGVVNIITKDGTQKFEGTASAYLGNFFTTHDNVFWNLEKVNTNGPKDFQFSFSGPTKLINGLTFFLSGRYFKTDGFIYGKRVYNADDVAPFIPDESDPSFFTNNNTGDEAYVSMNPEERKSYNGKLTYNLESWKFSYSLIWDNTWNKYYNHAFRLAPEGIKNHYKTNVINNLQISFFPSQNTFATLKLSSNLNKYWGYLYADELDPRYVDPNLSTPISDYTFRYGGNETDRYNRYTWSYVALLSAEAQVSKEHKIKAGVEGRYHEVYNHWKDLRNLTEGQFDDFGNSIWTPGYSNPGTKYHDEYKVHPYEISAYIQDKMEYDIMIINAGVRFDYFNSNTNLPVDIRNPLDNPLFNGANQRRKAEYETQVSPRLGVSFPISDEGAIHFSYGHFFQIPTFEDLYYNNAYNIDQTTTLTSRIGNPELKAQKTIKYELGLQQVLFPNISADISVYYSDIRNLLGMEILETYEGYTFARYINRDYGNVKGLILTLEKRYADYFSAKVDYTYQIAQGNASDPTAIFYNNQSDPPIETTKKLVPLDWDQTSTLNVSLTVGEFTDWTVGIIWSYGSGEPYTEAPRYTQNLRLENNGRKPSIMNVDLKATKTFNVFDLDINTYLIVYNLFDTKNEINVSTTSGRAGIDLTAEEFTGIVYGINTIGEYILNPTDYSAPREIRFGFGFGF
jgi:outer membrane receptor protein involved in Fe transport